jgi:hypothetical protein
MVPVGGGEISGRLDPEGCSFDHGNEAKCIIPALAVALLAFGAMMAASVAFGVWSTRPR